MASPKLPTDPKLRYAEEGVGPHAETGENSVVTVKGKPLAPFKKVAKTGQQILLDVVSKSGPRNLVKAGRKTRRRTRKHSRKNKWSRKK
jgi:antitoxin (DNA-binding transcriptional repressor) of toxin-antitoxin stability system